MLLARPTFDDIKAIHQTIYDDWSDLRARDSEMIDLWEMTYDVRAPEPKGIKNWTPKKVRSGWTRKGIKAYKAMFGDKPIFSHKPGIGRMSHKVSERIEGFLNTLPWALEAEYGTFWPEVLEDVFKLGRGWAEILPYRGRWKDDPDYPQRGEGTNAETGKKVPEDESHGDFLKRLKSWKKGHLPPISIRHLPAESVCAVITERYRVLRAVRKVKISLADAARRWPDEFGVYTTQEDVKLNEDVQIWEYVDHEWVATAAEYKDINGFIKPPYKHGMGMCPWVLVEGLTTASSEPLKRWEPVLFDVKDVGLAMDAQLTRKSMICEIFPLPFPVIKSTEARPQEGDEERPDIEIAPPNALYLYEDEEFAIAGWPPAEPEADSLWAKLDDAKERLLPDVGYDIARGASNTAAWTWRLRGQYTERDLAPVADNISLGAKRIAQGICRCIQSPHINQRVYVRESSERTKGEGYDTISVSPKELKGQVQCIDAEAKISNIMDRNSDIGAARLAASPPLNLPLRDVYETILKRENPQQLMEEKAIEEIEQSEPYKQRVLEEILMYTDILEEEKAMVPPDELMQMMAGGELSPAAQRAIRAIQGAQMAGLGVEGHPTGAHPNTVARTASPTVTQSGPTPFGTTPGAGVEY